MSASGLLRDLPALESKLAAVAEANKGLESLFVSDGKLILAASSPGKALTPVGGGASDKGSEIRSVIADGVAKAEIERRTDIVPRLTYIYPIESGGIRAGALVAKFSLAEEFGAISHMREAMMRILLISALAGVPILFAFLWFMAIQPLRRLRTAAMGLSEGDFDLSLPEARSSELESLSISLGTAAGILKSQYERYLSPQVVSLLRKERGFSRDIRMRTMASVLMCDIEGFTALSEGLDVNDLGLFLNGYFKAMTEIVFKWKGTLDKYMGDGILAVFGAPLAYGGFREDAIMAAVEMKAAYSREYPNWLPASVKEARGSRIRVGIATGEVFYGNVGYERRSDFTCLGTPVNLSSRLQEQNKETGTSILMDGETARGLSSEGPAFRHVGMIRVRGLADAVDAWGA